MVWFYSENNLDITAKVIAQSQINLFEYTNSLCIESSNLSMCEWDSGWGGTYTIQIKENKHDTFLSGCQITSYFSLNILLNLTNKHTHSLPLSKNKLNLHTPICMPTHIDTLKSIWTLWTETTKQRRELVQTEWPRVLACIWADFDSPCGLDQEKWSQAESLSSVRWMKPLSKLAVFPFWLYNTHVDKHILSKHACRYVHEDTHLHTYTQTSCMGW